MPFLTKVDPDQVERKEYAGRLYIRLSQFYKDHGIAEADRRLDGGENRTMVQDAIDKWGEEYAIALYNAALTKVVIENQILARR